MASLTEKKEKRVRVTEFPLGLAKKKKKGEIVSKRIIRFGNLRKKCWTLQRERG